MDGNRWRDPFSDVVADDVAFRGYAADAANIRKKHELMSLRWSALWSRSGPHSFQSLSSIPISLSCEAETGSSMFSVRVRASSH